MIKGEVQSPNSCLSKKRSVLTRALLHLLTKALKRPFHHKLTAKRAFFRWQVFTNNWLVKASVIELFKRSHITPTKAVWMLFHEAPEPSPKNGTLPRKEVISAGLILLCSLSRRSTLAKLLRAFMNIKQHRNLHILDVYSLQPLSYQSDGAGDENASKGRVSQEMDWRSKKRDKTTSSFRHIKVPQADIWSVLSPTSKMGQGLKQLTNILKMIELKYMAELLAKMKQEFQGTSTIPSLLNDILKAHIKRTLSFAFQRIQLGHRNRSSPLSGFKLLLKIISKQEIALAFKKLLEAAIPARKDSPSSDYLSSFKVPLSKVANFPGIRDEAEPPSKDTESKERGERKSTKTEVDAESLQSIKSRHRSFPKGELNRIFTEIVEDGFHFAQLPSGINQPSSRFLQRNGSQIRNVYYDTSMKDSPQNLQRARSGLAMRFEQASKIIEGLLFKRISYPMKKLIISYETKRVSKLIKVLSGAGNRVKKVLASCFAALRLQTIKRDWLISVMLGMNRLRSIFRQRKSNYFLWLKLEERVKNYRLCYNTVWMWKLRNEESKRFTIETRHLKMLRDKQILVRRVLKSLTKALDFRTLQAFRLLRNLNCPPAFSTTAASKPPQSMLLPFLARLLLLFERLRLQRIRLGMNKIAAYRRIPTNFPRKCIKSRFWGTFVGSPDSAKVSWNVTTSTKVIEKLKTEIITPREWNDKKLLETSLSFKSPQSHSTELNATDGLRSKRLYSIKEKLNLDLLSKIDKNRSDQLKSTNRSESNNPLFTKAQFLPRGSVNDEHNDSRRLSKLTTNDEIFKGIWSSKRNEFLSFRYKSGLSMIDINRSTWQNNRKKRTTLQILSLKKGVKIVQLLLQKSLREAMKRISKRMKVDANLRKSIESPSTERFRRFSNLRTSEPAVRICEQAITDTGRPEKLTKKAISQLNLDSLKCMNQPKASILPGRLIRMFPNSLVCKIKGTSAKKQVKTHFL
jgi:hypothetical protein